MSELKDKSDAAEAANPETEEVSLGEESQVGKSVMNVMRIFGKRMLTWVTIYLTGFFSISFGWLMAPLLFAVYREEQKKKKEMNFNIIQSIAKTNEKEFIQAIQRHTALPSWVTFPDMERLEWVNQIVYKLWPYAGQYVEDLCRETVEPSIAEALKYYKINNFKFNKIILGDTPPRFGGIKVYDDTSRHEIILDADMVYAGDCKFEIGISKLKAGIKDLKIAGRIRVVMKPLVRQVPLVGGLQVFFLNNPDVDFNLIGVADVLDMPGISDILRSIVVDQIAALMVLPNRYPLQLVEGINVVELKCPVPAGVLRVEVIEAQNLMKKDIGILGTGKSDPYCVLRLGAQKFTTPTINNTVNPKWNYCCEFMVHAVRNEEMSLDIFDYDDATDCDKLGQTSLDVQMIYNHGKMDLWLPLSEAKKGRVHIRATWLDLSDQSSDLDKQLMAMKELQPHTKNPLHSAVLMVWVDNARKLAQIPDPIVRVRVGNEVKESSVRQRTNDPVFEEGFVFLVRNPLAQEAIVEVVDQRTDTVLGKTQVELNALLQKKSMEITGETFHLDGSHLGEITLTLSLRVLKQGEGQQSGETVTPTASPAKQQDPPERPERHLARAPSEKEVESLIQPEEANPSQSAPLLPKQPEEAPRHVGEIESVVRQRKPVESQPEHVVTAPEVNLGRIQLTVKYGARDNLVVVVHKIEGLETEEDGELPDPYVKLYLLPDKSRDSKRKTEVVKDSCNPVFDERFEYHVAREGLAMRSIEVLIVNKKGFLKKSSVMGEVVVHCGVLDEKVLTAWYSLKPAMDEGDD